MLDNNGRQAVGQWQEWPFLQQVPIDAQLNLSAPFAIRPCALTAMLPRPRSVDCDVKPSFGQLQDETYVSQQCLNQYSSTGESQAIRHITALLDELFLVLYEPKEMAKLKVKPLHYSIQVPMRLRRLPKSFFIPPFNQQQPQPRPFVENSSLFSGKHAYHQHPRIKSHGPSVASGQHVQYCCSSKGATPTGTSLGPGESKGNNILFSRSNNHISFIEGHQYDARMYASIEVTATTLKYQKRLQLPSPSTHQQTLTGALKSTTNGSFLSTPGNRSNWDSTFPPTNAPYPMHSGPSQPNSWLNYARAPGQGQPYDDSDESSGTEQSEHNDKTTQSTSATGDYLDLDGFDGGIEFPPPTSALGKNKTRIFKTHNAMSQTPIKASTLKHTEEPLGR